MMMVMKSKKCKHVKEWSGSEKQGRKERVNVC